MPYGAARARLQGFFSHGMACGATGGRGAGAAAGGEAGGPTAEQQRRARDAAAATDSARRDTHRMRDT